MCVPQHERSAGTRGGCADLAQTWLSPFRSGIRCETVTTKHSWRPGLLRGGTFDPVMPLSRGTTLAQEAMGMLVLVARASKHGATEEITERVAQALTLTGQVGQLARKGRDLCHFAGHLCARDDANGRP